MLIHKRMHFKSAAELRTIYRTLIRKTDRIYDDVLRFYYRRRIVEYFRTRVHYYDHAYKQLCNETYIRITSAQAMFKQNDKIDLATSAEERLKILHQGPYRTPKLELITIFPLLFGEAHYSFYLRDLQLVSRFNAFLDKLLENEPTSLQIAVEYAYGLRGFVKWVVERARSTWILCPFFLPPARLQREFHPIHIMYITGMTLDEVKLQQGHSQFGGSIPLSQLCHTHNKLRYRQMVYDRIWPLPAEMRSAYINVLGVDTQQVYPLYNYRSDFTNALLPPNEQTTYLSQSIPPNFNSALQPSNDRLTHDDLAIGRLQKSSTPFISSRILSVPDAPVMKRTKFESPQSSRILERRKSKSTGLGNT